MRKRPNPPPEVQKALGYLLNGGFGEVVGMTEHVAAAGVENVACDLQIMRAILFLAAESVNARSAPVRMRFDK